MTRNRLRPAALARQMLLSRSSAGRYRVPADRAQRVANVAATIKPGREESPRPDSRSRRIDRLEHCAAPALRGSARPRSVPDVRDRPAGAARRPPLVCRSCPPAMAPGAASYSAARTTDTSGGTAPGNSSPPPQPAPLPTPAPGPYAAIDGSARTRLATKLRRRLTALIRLPDSARGVPVADVQRPY